MSGPGIPECLVIQALMPDLLAGELDAEVAAAVEGHARSCPVCGPLLAGERQVHDLVRARASRPAAPAALRERVAGLFPPRRGLRRLLGTPPRAALAAATLTALVLTPVLLLLLPPRVEPIQILAEASLSEHLQVGLRHRWRETWTDRASLLPYLRETLGLPLERLFAGDAEVELVEVTPSVILGEKGVALLYRDRSGRASTLLVLPGRGLQIPTRNRMRIETFQPYRARADRHTLLIWKQEGLTYSLVSEQEEAALARVFLKIRKAP